MNNNTPTILKSLSSKKYNSKQPFDINYDYGTMKDITTTGQIYLAHIMEAVNKELTKQLMYDYPVDYISNIQYTKNKNSNIYKSTFEKEISKLVTNDDIIMIDRATKLYNNFMGEINVKCITLSQYVIKNYMFEDDKSIYFKVEYAYNSVINKLVLVIDNISIDIPIKSVTNYGLSEKFNERRRPNIYPVDDLKSEFADFIGDYDNENESE